MAFSHGLLTAFIPRTAWPRIQAVQDSSKRDVEEVGGGGLGDGAFEDSSECGVEDVVSRRGRGGAFDVQFVTPPH